MIDRERLEALLANRFPGAARDQIAAAANAIMSMIRDVERLRQDRPERRATRAAARLRQPIA